jgi:hypothetical protein
MAWVQGCQLLAQGCRLAQCNKVVSYLKYTGHQVNVFVTAASHVGQRQRTDPTGAPALLANPSKPLCKGINGKI